MQRRILLVEDEPGARVLLAHALAARGVDVAQASGHAEALVGVPRGTFFDALVLDVVLGEGPDGLDLLATLREREITAPAIVITAFADTERLKRAIALRVAYLLEKPFTAAQLHAVLTRVFDEPGDLTHRVEQVLARAGLTPKEKEVARLVLKGLASDEIAHALQNSEKTIRQHLSAIYEKCAVESRAEFFHHVFPT